MFDQTGAQASVTATPAARVVWQVDVHGTGVDNFIIPPIADLLRFVEAIEDAKANSKLAGGNSA